MKQVNQLQPIGMRKYDMRKRLTYAHTHKNKHEYTRGHCSDTMTRLIIKYASFELHVREKHNTVNKTCI